ncbi:MAG: hypothetical protein ABF289_18710, partial [Clostridiales bacterium]
MKFDNDLNAKIFNKVKNYRLRFLVFYSTFLGRINMFLRKIDYGGGIKFYGKTYFFRAPKSAISIGNNVVFRSDETSNQVGVVRKCIISTLCENAKISIGDSSGFSGISIGAANSICIGSHVLVGANTLITDTNWHNID